MLLMIAVPTILMRRQKFPCELIRLEKNSGPAFARNTGVEKSRGDILFFIDSDTELDNKALGLIHETFENEKDIVAVVRLPQKDH